MDIETTATNTPLGWYERLLVEANELDARLMKIRTFLDSNEYTELPAGDRDLLQDQYNFMHGYSKILTARINRNVARLQAAPSDPTAENAATGIEVHPLQQGDITQQTGLEQADPTDAPIV
jgi:hypothetical protein